MRSIEPIVAGEHFSAAQRPHCRVPEQRRQTKFKNFPPHLCYFADQHGCWRGRTVAAALGLFAMNEQSV
jgi:hypothetical protein